MPTPLANPWPSGPVVVSTPGVIPRSGCPGHLLPHWRNRAMRFKAVHTICSMKDENPVPLCRHAKLVPGRNWTRESLVARGLDPDTLDLVPGYFVFCSQGKDRCGRCAWFKAQRKLFAARKLRNDSHFLVSVRETKANAADSNR